MFFFVIVIDHMDTFMEGGGWKKNEKDLQDGKYVGRT